MNDGEGQALALRCGVAFFIVARGPVPRERGNEIELFPKPARGSVARGPVPRHRWIIRGMAGDRPPPYVLVEVSVSFSLLGGFSCQNSTSL